ncbi:MAG: DUF5678 domain-containing protein [bacterium]|nr:DUF5678 domain-containing protein [bacterium]
MPGNILVNDGEKYSGQYVATRSFTDKDVVASGTDPLKLIAEVKGLGVGDPVVFFVPKEDVVQIY